MQRRRGLYWGDVTNKGVSLQKYIVNCKQTDIFKEKGFVFKPNL